MITHCQKRATTARAILDAAKSGPEDLETRIQDHLADLGHLCDAEKLDFLEVLRRGIRYWAVERIDPNAIEPGPTVNIIVGSDGLPPPPSPKKPRKPMTRKSRPQR